jgi:hypothetical protein
LNKDTTCFTSDASSWTASKKQTTNLYYQCGSKYLVGGQGILRTLVTSQGEYFSRTYSGLQPHSNIRFSLTVFAIDGWGTTSHADSFKIGIDTLIINGWSLKYTDFPTPLCGGTAFDLPDIRVFGHYAHSANTLTFKVISDLDDKSQSESFGFRDLNILFDQSATTLNSICAKASITLTPNQCQCVESTYFNTSSSSCQPCDGACSSCYGWSPSKCYSCATNYGWTGSTCVSCSTNCESCSDSLSTKCYSCIAGKAYFPAGNQCFDDCFFPLTKTTTPCGIQCTLPCPTNNFIYWDGSCGTTCPSPYQISSLGTIATSIVQLCNFPCTPVEFLYPDGNCRPDCQAPLTLTKDRGMNSCKSPCTTPSDYLLPSGSCSATCPDAMIPSTALDVKLCKTPCTISTDFLYWNKDCVASCPAPLTTTTLFGTLKYCDYKCSATEYLYWNGTCKSACNFPLQVRTERGKQFCDYPTDTSQFLYWDGTTDAACDTPLRQRFEGNPQRKFCDYGCKIHEWLNYNGNLHDQLFSTYACNKR